MKHTALTVTGAGGILALVVLTGAHPDWNRYLRAWPGYAHNAQHAATSRTAAQPLNAIHWSTPVDLQPQYSGSVLYIHYGSPLVTTGNTVVVTVKTGAGDGFRVEGRHGADGTLLWTQETDYSLPPHGWTPSCGPTLTREGHVIIPAAGGTVLRRFNADNPTSGPAERMAFYGRGQYDADPGAFNGAVQINTPITADAAGNVYFGFFVGGSNPAGLVSGLARISATGQGSWVSAPAMTGDPNTAQIVHNCAPALTPDGSTIYVTARDFWNGGYLVALDSTTLATLHTARLHDPYTGNDAAAYDDGTASPTIAPDGDVYFGVLENPFGSNHLRGWLLHYNADLSELRTPGAFGWDDTASIVPASAVPLYTGSSPYLLLTKYNNYVEGGGDGVNKVAVLDPHDTEIDPITGTTVMREVLTLAGPTPDDEFRPNYPNAVREWCINTAAVDPAGRCGMVNSEDGKLYRWDFTTGQITQTVTLTPGIGEAYTPTVIGPDGTVYAINNATLFAVGR